MKAAFSHCPVEGCRGVPSPLFCASHWASVSGDVRRLVMREFRIMTTRAQQTMSPRMLEALGVAIRECNAPPAQIVSAAGAEPHRTRWQRFRAWLRESWVRFRYGPLLKEIEQLRAGR